MRVRALRRAAGDRVASASALWTRLAANMPLRSLSPGTSRSAATSPSPPPSGLSPSSSPSGRLARGDPAAHTVDTAAGTSGAGTSDRLGGAGARDVHRLAHVAAGGSHMPLESWPPRPGSPPRLLDPNTQQQVAASAGQEQQLPGVHKHPHRTRAQWLEERARQQQAGTELEGEVLGLGAGWEEQVLGGVRLRACARAGLGLGW